MARTEVWQELKKRKGNEKCPVLEVFGNDELTWRYENGNTERLVKKTFQNDMTAIRKKK